MSKRLARLRVAARVCTVLGAIILVLVAVVGIGAAVLPRVLGMHSFAIVTGSMEPNLPTGSLVYAEPVGGSSLEVGDVAVFWRDSDVIVHRVDSINADDHELITKGDANAGVDVRPVPYSNVVGRVVLCVPYAGYFLMAIGSLSGKLLLGWIVLMGAALCLIGSVLSGLALQNPAKE